MSVDTKLLVTLVLALLIAGIVAPFVASLLGRKTTTEGGW